MDGKPLLMPIPKATEEIGIGITKTRELINEGEIETVKIGRKPLVVYAGLKALVEKLRAAA